MLTHKESWPTLTTNQRRSGPRHECLAFTTETYRTQLDMDKVSVDAGGMFGFAGLCLVIEESSWLGSKVGRHSSEDSRQLWGPRSAGWAQTVTLATFVRPHLSTDLSFRSQLRICRFLLHYVAYQHIYLLRSFREPKAHNSSPASECRSQASLPLYPRQPRERFSKA